MPPKRRRRGWIRQSPSSGLYTATVRLPAGRITESFELLSHAEDWVDEQYSQVRRGEWIDPRGGGKTIGEVWAKYGDSRTLELASRRRDASHWRCHVEAQWADVPVGSVLKPDVSGWVETMRRRKVGPTTIEGALGVLRAALELAVEAKLIRGNPAADVKAPPRNAHLDRVLSPEEDVLLLDALDRLFPGRVDGWLAIELMLYCGLRFEEMGALDRDHVDLRQQMIRVGPVLERDGTIRPYPKSPAGKRRIKVPLSLWPRLRARAMTLTGDQLLVTSPTGKPLDYSRWHDRLWSVALHGRPAIGKVRGHKPREAIPGAGLADPLPTPHDLRHSFATRLGEQGVPAPRIMYVMGHESLATSQRYIHDTDGRHEDVASAVDAVRLPRAQSG